MEKEFGLFKSAPYSEIYRNKRLFYKLMYFKMKMGR